MDLVEVQARLNNLTKPIGSLGRLETLALELGRTQKEWPESWPRRLVLFAADHGVVVEGVSAWPSEVTARMVETIARGKSASSVLARKSH
ncbi:MAG: nicotinate-nucleotide--dimethylbenzimidazole phosphoribosyltransferase, partial [Gemmataceae bacterium]